jgi:hypothetical protein
MIVTIKSWKKLLLFCLGLAASAAFCMKWMEPDLWVTPDEKFTILGLELFYAKEKVFHILSVLDPRVETILRYHLTFDFAFMAGVYPGIAALCMIAKEKVRRQGMKRFLYFLAVIQWAAWAADVTENYYLLHWLKDTGDGSELNSQFGFYHFVVGFKWIVALIGVLFSVTAILVSRGPDSNRGSEAACAANL